MKIAVEGCAHGELETIYGTIAELEKQENVKIDLVICCGDFQSTRNLNDLQCMAVPQKYADICTFYKYYSGEKTAPYLTIFIGGNHEASNYLQELPYGGWVAPNVYYLGYAGVVDIGGIRIGGISGIYKPFDYTKGHFEIAPYDDSTVRSVYHIRNVEVFRLKQLSQPVDIFLSHDWPTGIHKYGNVCELLKKKPFFKADIESNKLGSVPCEELLKELKPKYWFSAHLHCKFAALVPHSDGSNTDKNATKFLALDKCLPRRRFLQIIDIPHDPNSKIHIKYDLEWLTVLFLTNHLLNVKKTPQYMPGPGSVGRWNFTPTKEEKEFVLEKIGNDLTVPLNFSPTVHAYTPNSSKTEKERPIGQTNIQTKLFCDKLCIDDPTELLLKLSRSYIDDSTNTSHNSSLNLFIPRSVEIKHNKLNLSLPEPQNEPNSPKIAKLNLTLPPPKNTVDDSFNNIDSAVENCSFVDSEIDSVNSSVQNVSNTSFSDVDVSSSTPQTKKFKRRNESIYKVEND